MMIDRKDLSAPEVLPATNAPIDRLIGVYHASGTPWGELSYWLKARVGSTHCALCDITHGSVREKTEWKACRRQLPVPFDTVHLNERDERLAAFTDGQTPCVVAETAAGLVMLVDPVELIGCTGSPDCLISTVSRNAAARGLALTASDTSTS
jgi:hypothetical protein